MTTVTPINVARTTAQIETETPKKEKATITFQEWWSGEKSLTSTAARRVGWENLADWLEDKDKVCTDGQDDGNIGFKEGAKSFAKGLVGGIPKAMINHPLITAGVIAGGAALTVLTGGAAAPILWGLGAVAVGASATTNIVKAATADTDGEKKAALEGTGTATASAALLGATYGTTMKSATQAGVKTDGNFVQTMKSSAEISARNAQANYMTWKTGVIQPNSNIGRVQEQAIAEAKELVDKGVIEKIEEAAPSIIKRAGVKMEEPQYVGYFEDSYPGYFSGKRYGTIATRNGKSIYVEEVRRWSVPPMSGIRRCIVEELANGKL